MKQGTKSYGHCHGVYCEFTGSGSSCSNLVRKREGFELCSAMYIQLGRVNNHVQVIGGC